MQVQKFAAVLGLFVVAAAAAACSSGSQDPELVGAVQQPAVAAETLASYVTTCQQQLSFQSIPNLDCYDGLLFAPSSGNGDLVNDYVGYLRVNDQVDLAFACRWLFGSKTSRLNPISLEMSIHNRANGRTCFFSAEPKAGPNGFEVSSMITSPTDPAASSYWRTPAEVDSTVRCIGCHVSGPYVATPRIAPFLAQYGLLNNGHDTLTTLPGRYHAVGTTFAQWDSLARSYVSPGASGCASGCHQVGAASPQGSIFLGGDILLLGPADILTLINEAGAMPPTHNVFSDYRWVNLDTPTNADLSLFGGLDYGEYETYGALQAQYPQFACAASPSLTIVEAHPVGIGPEGTFSTADFPDKLHIFNLQDGLVCLNNDQPSGVCQDYFTRYVCNGAVTPWKSHDTPGGSGDWETRSGYTGLCAAPTAIQARWRNPDGSGWFYAAGPPDRLAEFDANGLFCNNADQTNGLCSNYVVRFDCGSGL